MSAVKRYQKDGELSYTLGMTLTFELLQAPALRGLVKTVYIHSELAKGASCERLMELCEKGQIPVEQNDKVFHILSQKENCYVIGAFRKYRTELAAEESHLVLVNPSNAGNLGTILRSCVGFGMKNIAVIKPAVDLFDPKTVRASMGALFHMNFRYYDSFAGYRAGFPEHHFYPFMLDADSELPQTCFEAPFSLIFGNEATGLPADYHAFGHSVIIPQSDEVDSLNLTIAVGIALYESKTRK